MTEGEKVQKEGLPDLCVPGFCSLEGCKARCRFEELLAEACHSLQLDKVPGLGKRAEWCVCGAGGAVGAGRCCKMYVN